MATPRRRMPCRCVGLASRSNRPSSSWPGARRASRIVEVGDRPGPSVARPALAAASRNRCCSRSDDIHCPFRTAAGSARRQAGSGTKTMSRGAVASRSASRAANSSAEIGLSSRHRGDHRFAVDAVGDAEHRAVLTADGRESLDLAGATGAGTFDHPEPAGDPQKAVPSRTDVAGAGYQPPRTGSRCRAGNRHRRLPERTRISPAHWRRPALPVSMSTMRTSTREPDGLSSRADPGQQAMTAPHRCRTRDPADAGARRVTSATLAVTGAP